MIKHLKAVVAVNVANAVLLSFVLNPVAKAQESGTQPVQAGIEVTAPETVKGPVRARITATGLITHFEGFRAKAYMCPAKHWTIGYGQTAGVKPGMTTTEAKAVKSVEHRVTALRIAIRLTVHTKLSRTQENVLISFADNIGLGKFERSTLLKALNRGDLVETGHQIMRWCYIGKKVSAGLVKRRGEERAIFQSS